jgi:hypothetical protein
VCGWPTHVVPSCPAGSAAPSATLQAQLDEQAGEIARLKHELEERRTTCEVLQRQVATNQVRTLWPLTHPGPSHTPYPIPAPTLCAVHCRHGYPAAAVLHR